MMRWGLEPRPLSEPVLLIAARRCENLIEDDVSNHGFSANRAGVKEPLTMQPVRVAPKHSALARGRVGFCPNSNENRNVLKAVKTIRNKKRHDHNIGLLGNFVPI